VGINLQVPPPPYYGAIERNLGVSFSNHLNQRRYIGNGKIREKLVSLRSEHCSNDESYERTV
jgi:hypothetical protein